MKLFALMLAFIAVAACKGQRPGPPGPTGFVDVVNCDEIAGWAWDPEEHGGPAYVEVLDGSEVIAKGEAGKARPDLLTAGIGEGTHAFSFKTPQLLKDGKQHTITARLQHSGMALPGGPKPLVCGGD